MPHIIKTVTTLPDYVLQVHFRNGFTKQYDLKPLIKDIDIYRHFLVEEKLYDDIRISDDGEAVVWGPYLDLGCEEMWHNGKKVTNPFDNLLSFFDAASMWHIDESTLRKAVKNNRLRDGIDVMKFGKQWLITPASMIRLFGPMPDHESEYEKR